MRRGFVAIGALAAAMEWGRPFCFTMQRKEMRSLLRDDHLGSALHCKTRGQKREQKLE
jgi:hypothetical protein